MKHGGETPIKRVTGAIRITWTERGEETRGRREESERQREGKRIEENQKRKETKELFEVNHCF